MLPFTWHRLHLDLIRSKVNASDPHRTAGKELHGTVACRLHHRLRRSTQPLPHLGEEHLDAALKEAGGVADRLHALYVEFVSQDLAKFGLVTTADAKDDARPSERLTCADVRCATNGSAKFCGTDDAIH